MPLIDLMSRQPTAALAILSPERPPLTYGGLAGLAGADGGSPQRPGHRPPGPGGDRPAQRTGDGQRLPGDWRRRHHRARSTRPTAPTSSTSICGTWTPKALVVQAGMESPGPRGGPQARISP